MTWTVSITGHAEPNSEKAERAIKEAFDRALAEISTASYARGTFSGNYVSETWDVAQQAGG
jgi:hypothetical protein